MMEHSISIVLVTFNRVHLLRQCVERVLARASALTREIVIWDNASTDGTAEYLRTVRDPRIQVVSSAENIGTNAYARVFPKCVGTHMIELDDDVIDAPADWDRQLLEAFVAIPRMGYLAANVIDDGKSVASDVMYRRSSHLYTRRETNGVALMEGPPGGWCTMTSREVYDAVGGFREDRRFVFWHEDAEYAGAVARGGYHGALLADLKVFHASGPAYSDDPRVAEEKLRYYAWDRARRVRKEIVKRVLEAIPPVRVLNRRFRWYRIVPFSEL